MPDPQRKPDAARIKARIATLQQADWLGSHKWWPQYVYHFAELKNVVAILTAGQLCCRNEHRMLVDTASSSVIANTEDHWKAYVRFYFRPRTPTQYQVEGFRPPTHYGTLGKHCPMLFILMFEAADILTLADTEFTNGNLAGSRLSVGRTADFFEALPFPSIYHEGSMPPDAKKELTFHRCAEVIVPGRVDLSALRYVCCRSDAEYSTLSAALPAAVRTQYLKKITSGAAANVHFRYWSFVESVSVEYRLVTFRFNPSSYTPGPFHAKATFTSPVWGVRIWENPAYSTNANQAKLAINLGEVPLAAYEAKLELDGNLAYLGSFSPTADGILVPARR